MISQISLAVLIVSFLVLTYLLIRKTPLLIELEETPSKKMENPFLKIKEKLLEVSFVKNFSWNAVLQKMLSKTRIIILKIEGKIGDQLHFLRKSSKKQK